jgi:glutaredoxin-like protein NrdH
MTKALLSQRGVEFDALDVANDAQALSALRDLGLSSVPAVVVGDRSMTGWNPTKLAELVGFAYDERAAPAEELIGSIGQIVEAAIRAVAIVPDDCWERSAEDRKRPLRELARHLFDIVEKGVDADVLSMFPAGAWLTNQDVTTLANAHLMTRYGEAVRAKFAAWYAEPLDRTAFARVIEADVGPRTLTQVLERTRLHAGQHLRQIYVILSWCGITPPEPLSDEDLRQLGLELPTDVF